MEIQNFDHRHQLIATLMKLSANNGNVASSESSYILFLATEMGITKEEFGFVINWKDKLSYPRPEGEQEKARCLFQMLKMVFSNNKIDSFELTAYYKIGKILGLEMEKLTAVGEVWLNFSKTDINESFFMAYWNQALQAKKMPQPS